MPTSQASYLTYGQVIRLSVPVMLAQAAIAATGVVDTAVMGLVGTKADLGAVAVASVAFSFVYWGFGFLRMSTTGLVAQAEGRGEQAEARAVAQRALLLGGAIGLILLALSPILKPYVFQPFGAEALVDQLASEYFAARIWGAPALLMTYGMMGWLLGTGRTGTLLAMQIVMNGVNIALDAWFVLELGWGPAGIGAGTAIAEWAAVIFGFFAIRGVLKPGGRLRDGHALRAMLTANRDILIRTLAMLFCFAWFVRSGAQLGTAELAGNEVLLQFITVSAFILDGFAFVAEKEVGEAYGSRNRARLLRAMWITSVLAFAFSVLISGLYLFGGAAVIETFIADPDARAIALTYLPYCALVPLIGVAAFQLDGFLIGATQGQALRTAALTVTPIYVCLDIVLRSEFGNHGVWLAFLGMYVVRVIAHGWFIPPMIRKTGADPHPRHPTGTETHRETNASEESH
ncbi:MAG: MATE family efflux transporter [Pseudomonadota bacterium]